MDGDDIQVVESQLARLVGDPVVIIYNAVLDSSCSQKNMRACRLSTDITEGKHTPVRVVMSNVLNYHIRNETFYDADLWQCTCAVSKTWCSIDDNGDCGAVGQCNP